MIAVTQIGGKYHPDDSSLFQLKRRLQAADIVVSHPIADTIIASADGQNYAFDPTVATFYEVETNYYHCIRDSNFHMVNNTFLTQSGYIGASAALEICYAMLHRRPIVLRYQPQLKSGLDAVLSDALQNNTSHFYVSNLLKLSLRDIQQFVLKLPKTCHYNLAVTTQRHIAQLVNELLVTLHDERV